MTDPNQIWKNYYELEEEYYEPMDVCPDLAEWRKLFDCFIRTAKSVRSKSKHRWKSMTDLVIETDHDFTEFVFDYLDELGDEGLYRSLEHSIRTLSELFPEDKHSPYFASCIVESLIHLGKKDQLMEWCEKYMMSKEPDLENLFRALIAAGCLDIAKEICDRNTELFSGDYEVMDRSLLAAARIVYDAAGNEKRVDQLSSLIAAIDNDSDLDDDYYEDDLDDEDWEEDPDLDLPDDTSLPGAEKAFPEDNARILQFPQEELKENSSIPIQGSKSDDSGNKDSKSPK